MPLSMKRSLSYPTLAALAALLAACGSESGGGTDNSSESSGGGDSAAPAPAKLFANDFKPVCSGATVSAATAYDPEAESHKAVYFGTHKDDLIDRSSSLPDDWTVRFSAEEDVYKQVDIVICAKRTSAEKVKVCDGYKTDGKETQNKVNWHTATYEVTAVAATSGETLAEKTIEADDTSCPMFQSFNGTNDEVDEYARLKEAALTEFMAPLMKK